MSETMAWKIRQQRMAQNPELQAQAEQQAYEMRSQRQLIKDQEDIDMVIHIAENNARSKLVRDVTPVQLKIEAKDD